MSEQPERNLIEDALDGDSSAFGELVQRHQQDVFNVCYRITGNREDAEDLAQETFIRAHRKLHTFSLKFTFGPWVRKIAANVCLNELKKHYRKTEQMAGDDLEWRFQNPSPGPAAITENHAQVEVIREAIQSLPLAYRSVIELRHYQDLSYKEIAKTLKIPLEHVKSNLFRARKRLARILNDDRI